MESAALGQLDCQWWSNDGANNDSYSPAVSPRDYCLSVFSLPDLRLVHRHVLQSIALAGLASDLTGSTLLVSDCVHGGGHVVPWPLPGMPVRQCQ